MIYLQEEISTMLRDQSLKKETNVTEEPGGNVEKLDEDKNIDTKKEKAGLEEISTITSQELKSKSLKLALDRRFGLLWPTPQVDRYYTGVHIFFKKHSPLPHIIFSLNIVYFILPELPNKEPRNF